MKRKIVLSLVALGSVLALSSCFGVTGPTGPTGPSGSAGVDGTNGKDGTTWLTGEGVPSADLGNVGDLYLDTATYDIYRKNDSGWELTGNIKGDKGDQGEPGEKGDQGEPGEKGDQGEPGEKGDQGEPGEKGDQGETAWSNTILPSDGGYVTVDKGSAIADGKETVTFTAFDTDPADGKIPYSLTLTNNGVSERHDLDDDNQYTAVMKEGGYVVSLNFADELTTSESLTAVFDTALDEGENDFVLGEGTFDLTPEKDALDYSKSEKTVFVGSVDETGKPTTTLKLGKDIDFNGAVNAGTLELKNLNIELSAPVQDHKVFMFNQGKDVVLENVHILVNQTINTDGLPSILYFNTPDADVTIKDVSIDNTAAATYYDALQIWTAKSFTAENVEIKNVDNPFTIHLFDAGDRFSFKNCDFDTYSPMMFANENAYAKKTKEDYDAYKEGLEADRPKIQFSGCDIVSEYPYMAYYYLSGLTDENSYQADYSWLDIDFVDTTFQGEAFTAEVYNGNEKGASGYRMFELYDNQTGKYWDGPTPTVTFGA